MFVKTKDLYYSIKYGMSNVIKWFTTIWKLREWDASYLYLLIYKHLSHVEHCLRHYGHTVNSIKHVNKIRITKNLAKRLHKQEYLFNALIPVEEKYGELECHFKSSEYKGLMKLVFNESPEEQKARVKAYDHAEYMKKQDKERLFVMLNKYIDNWWD